MKLTDDQMKTVGRWLVEIHKMKTDLRRMEASNQDLLLMGELAGAGVKLGRFLRGCQFGLQAVQERKGDQLE